MVKYTMMAPHSDFASSMAFLVAWPLLLTRSLCLSGTKVFYVVICAWIQLVISTLLFHLRIFWRVVGLTVAFIYLPVRIMNALEKENELETKVVELEKMLADTDRLKNDQVKLILALSEAEDERDKAAVNMELLKIQLKEAMGMCPVHGGRMAVSRVVLGGGAPVCIAASIVYGRGSRGAAMAAAGATFFVVVGAICILQMAGGRLGYGVVGLLALDCFVLGLVLRVN